MDKVSKVDIYRCTTLDVPQHERFDAWASGGSCAYSMVESVGVPFDWETTVAMVGPMSIGWHTWLHPSRRAIVKATRSPKEIAARGLDLYQFTLHLNGGLSWKSDSRTCTKQPNELYVTDATQSVEATVTAGNMLWVAIPRALLPANTELLHGESLTHGIGQLFADHLRSLANNLPRLTTNDAPHVAQSTIHLASACASTDSDLREQASVAIDDALLARVQRYIDANLLDYDLTPNLICKDVGVSRSRLYQLFEPHGGVMRQIQRKRLELVYRTLADPTRPKESIASIAWRNGFRDEKYLCRIFKAEFGHTPSETLEQIGRALPR